MTLPGAAFLPPLGLESCWGFPVSDACLRELSCVVLRLFFSSSPGRCFSGFGGVALRFCHPLGLNPAGVSLFRMHASESYLAWF